MGQSGSGSGSGNTNAYVQAGMILGNAALNSYSARQAAKEQKKAAQAAAQPRYSMQYQTPYMNDRLAAIIPYILQNQQSVFENRMKGYGAKAGDFSAIANLLAGISPNYSGVGTPGSPMDNQFGGAGATSAFNSTPQGTTASGMPTVYGGSSFPNYHGLTAEDEAKKQERMQRFGEQYGGVVKQTLPDGTVINMAKNPVASLGRKRTQYREGGTEGGLFNTYGGGGGGVSFDVLQAAKDPNYAKMMLGMQDSLGRIGSSGGDLLEQGWDPSLGGEEWSARGGGLSAQDLYDLQKMLKENKLARTVYSTANQFNPLGPIYSGALKLAGSDWFVKQHGLTPQVVGGFMDDANTGRQPGYYQY